VGRERRRVERAALDTNFSFLLFIAAIFTQTELFLQLLERVVFIISGLRIKLQVRLVRHRTDDLLEGRLNDGVLNEVVSVRLAEPHFVI